MNKLLILSLLGVFCLSASAQPDSTNQREKILARLNSELQFTEIMDYLHKLDEKINKSLKNSKPILAIQYKSFAGKVKRWRDYRWLTADTGLDSKWLNQVQELLAYLAKIQAFIEAARINGNNNTPEYGKALKFFDTARQNFSNLLKKPTLVSAKVRRKSRQGKKLWQKAMRKKYQ
jgi:hypothetical protein